MKIKDKRKLCETFEDLDFGEVFSIAEDGEFFIKTERMARINAARLNDGVLFLFEDVKLVYPVKC